MPPHDARPDPVVEAMRARRRELITQPLDRIYRQLFDAGLSAHLAQLSELPDPHPVRGARP